MAEVPHSVNGPTFGNDPAVAIHTVPIAAMSTAGTLGPIGTALVSCGSSGDLEFVRRK
jgi:hypothetical protein